MPSGKIIFTGRRKTVGSTWRCQSDAQAEYLQVSRTSSSNSTSRTDLFNSPEHLSLPSRLDLRCIYRSIARILSSILGTFKLCDLLHASSTTVLTRISRCLLSSPKANIDAARYKQFPSPLVRRATYLPFNLPVGISFWDFSSISGTKFPFSFKVKEGIWRFNWFALIHRSSNPARDASWRSFR